TADTLARCLARRAPSRIAAICNGPARCAAWLCTPFWQQWPSGPWHDRARPATSRRVLATRPVGLREHSARSLHRRAGTDGAFAAPSVRCPAAKARRRPSMALCRGSSNPLEPWRGKGMKAQARRLIVAGAALALLPAFALWQGALAQAADKVTVRFTWKLKGEYAPLFVALDKGYYRAEGLDVDLAEGSGAQTVLKLLASGNEKVGYGPAVSAAQAVSQGLPVKVVALYQTKAPMGVISFPDVPLKTPKDLEGKRLAISVGETFGDMLGPFTRINNVDIGKIQQIQMDASARTAQFLTRKIDVMSVYLSNEWPQIEKRAGVKFNVLRVSEF